MLKMTKHVSSSLEASFILDKSDDVRDISIAKMLFVVGVYKPIIVMLSICPAPFFLQRHHRTQGHISNHVHNVRP